MSGASVHKVKLSMFLLMPLFLGAEEKAGLNFTLVSLGVLLIPYKWNYHTYEEDNVFPFACSLLELSVNVWNCRTGISLLRKFQMGLWNPSSSAGFVGPVIIEKEYQMLKNLEVYTHLELPVIGIYLNKKKKVNNDNAVFYQQG